MSDYLPPIVTKLDGDISGLATKLAEAEGLVDQYGRNVEKSAAEHGKAAGEAGGKGLTDKLGEEIDRPTVADKPLSRLADRVQKKFKEIGEKSGRDFADSVEQEAKQLEGRLASLADEFSRTGSFDVFKQYKDTQSDLGLVNKVRKEFELVKAEAAKAGSSIEQALTGGDGAGGRKGLLGMSAGFAKEVASGVIDGAKAGLDEAANLASDHKVGMAIAAGIVVASPAIGAALDAAILLGVGGGGLVAGIVAAAQDARVKSAWSGMIGDVKNKFIDASTPMVQPLISGADKFGAEFDKLLPGIQRGMGQLAPVLDRIITGFVGMIDKMGPGFGRAFEASLPVLKQLADDLPGTGQALSNFFDSMARGGEGAQQGLHDLVTVINATIIATGWLIGHLSQLWDFLRNNQIGKDLLDLIPGGSILNAIDDFGSKGKKAGEDVKKGMDDTAQGAAHAATEIDKTKKSLSDFISEALRMQDSQLALQKGLFDIAKAFDQNGASLDINTEKGLANREAMQHQVEQIARWRQEQLDAGKAPAYVNSEIDKQIALMYADAKAHGANVSQLDALIAQWRTILNLPSNKSLTTTITTISQRIDNGNVVPGSGGRRIERYGGIVQHAASGMITRPGIYEGRGEGSVVMAERETKREGYLPENASAPTAYGLLSEMASWKGWSIDTGGGRGGGGAAAPAGGGSSAGGGTTTQVLQLVVDGQVFFEKVVMPHAQQFINNNGFSGTS